MFFSSAYKLSRIKFNTKLFRILHTNRKSNYKPKIEDLYSLPAKFLRASDSFNYDASTHQRIDVPIDNETGKPKVGMSQRSHFSIEKVTIQDENFNVQWSDGKTSVFSSTFVDEQIKRRNGQTTNDRILWENMTEERVRNSSELSLSFDELITDDGMKVAMSSIYKFGILLVTDTPINDESAISALGATMGGGSKKMVSNSVLVNYKEGGDEVLLPHGTDGPLRTLYGTVWNTTSSGQADGSSVADSAYGCDGLPLHTDMTYCRDPPGLQIFTMKSPALEGGESVFADGFALASHLRDSSPEAFYTLSNTSRRYRCIDNETGWQLEASGPIIQVRHGQIVGIRHNDLDRLPDLPPKNCLKSDEVDEFYDSLEKAHILWDSLIAQDRFRLVMKLKPGDTMVVANQRCMHGRHSFKSTADNPRSVGGCYIGQDELNSRMRMEGFQVY